MTSNVTELAKTTGVANLMRTAQRTPLDARAVVKAANDLYATVCPDEGATLAMDPAAVLAMWKTEGPLIHEPTGFATLDRLTDGGPVYGSRWYLLGAPDSGKTLKLIQIADVYMDRGVVVGLLAVDEEAGDVITRVLQRRGFTRHECEQRDPAVLQRMAERLEGLPLRMYDGSWTIERAAADLHAFANGRRAMLAVDSIQLTHCDADAGATSVREAVTARVVAFRSAAQRYRFIGIATSEMSRAFYRSVDAAENTDDMASAKESGAIEYSARVMLALRSVAKESDLIEMRIAKNKHGPKGDKIHFRLDRRLQELTETESPPEVDRAEERAQAKNDRAHGRNLHAAAALVRVLLATPGITIRKVLGALRSELGACGEPLASTARQLLRGALVEVAGSNRAAHLYLDGSKLPPEVLLLLDGETRARSIAARPSEVIQ